jgi:hypothetical protein
MARLACRFGRAAQAKPVVRPEPFHDQHVFVDKRRIAPAETLR